MGSDGARVVAALLAAGEGNRFRASGGTGHKLMSVVGDERVIDRCVRSALRSGIGLVAVVLGDAELEPLPEEVIRLPNPRWAEGMATSLAVAVDWAASRDAEAVVVGLADQPGVQPSAWRAVADAPPVPPVAIATYGARPANPVRLHRDVWPLLPRTGDVGARAVVRDRPDLAQAVPCDGSPDDIDTVEDLERWS